MKGSRALMWSLLAVALVALLAVAAFDDPSTADPDDRVERLTQELRCPTCVNESVFESRSATAEAIRTDVARRLAAGESDSEIRAAYVERYTEWILLTPPDDGIGLVVWGLPVVIVVIGAAGIGTAIFAGGRRRAATSEDEALVDRLRTDS